LGSIDNFLLFLPLLSIMTIDKISSIIIGAQPYGLYAIYTQPSPILDKKYFSEPKMNPEKV
jgi:hypothetical protein